LSVYRSFPNEELLTKKIKSFVNHHGKLPDNKAAGHERAFAVVSSRQQSGAAN
jgi:hypothetical protein